MKTLKNKKKKKLVKKPERREIVGFYYDGYKNESRTLYKDKK